MLRDRQQHLPRSLRRCNGGVYVYSWERQSGAVASRALGVWPDYLAHARVLDERFSMPDTTPIQDCLLGYSRVRALVFGRYGEASADVHALLAAVACARASRVWRRWGGRRTEAEVSSCRAAASLHQ